MIVFIRLVVNTTRPVQDGGGEPDRQNDSHTEIVCLYVCIYI